MCIRDSHGTILKEGFHFVNPFVSFNNPAYTKELERAKAEAAGQPKKLSSGSVRINAKKTVSMKNMTLNNGTQKVNDVMGLSLIHILIEPIKSATKGLSGLSYISSGVPLCITEALFMTTILSAIVSASS